MKIVSLFIGQIVTLEFPGLPKCVVKVNRLKGSNKVCLAIDAPQEIRILLPPKQSKRTPSRDQKGRKHGKSSDGLHVP